MDTRPLEVLIVNTTINSLDSITTTIQGTYLVRRDFFLFQTLRNFYQGKTGNRFLEQQQDAQIRGWN